MKLRTLIESKESLLAISKESLPISISWDLTKFIKTINPDITSYEEVRNNKVIELGSEKTGEGVAHGSYFVKPENIELFQTAINELLDKEIPVVTPQIKIKDLVDYKDANGKSLNIPVSVLMKLDWLIVD